MPEGFTYQEIKTQFAAWQDANSVLIRQQNEITQFWERGNYDRVIFTGCGSTHYLSLSAAAMFQSKTGVPSRAVPASEILLHPEEVFATQSRPLLVTISRSATTTETVQAARVFRQKYGDHIFVISCYADKALNDLASLTLAATAGQEKSVAQTRSFSAMLILAEGLAQIIGNAEIDLKDFSASLGTSITDNEKPASDFSDAEQFSQYFYLGSGARYGLACEAMLKMKEMSLTHAEAYHPMEFRHGPMSMVDDKTLIVGLLGTDAYKAEKAVLDDMRQLGATVIEISPHATADFVLAADSAKDSIVRYLPIVQWMAYWRAINKGLDPDQPRNLNQVVELQHNLSE